MTSRDPQNPHDERDARDARDERFERWLLEAARGARAASEVPAPVGLTDRVMARIATALPAVSAARVAPIALHDPLPWWVRAAANRASVLALLVLALVTAFPAALLRAPAVLERLGALALGVAGGALMPFVRPFLAPISGSFGAPGMGFALSLALLAPTLLASVVLYRWSAGIASAFTKQPR